MIGVGVVTAVTFIRTSPGMCHAHEKLLSLLYGSAFVSARVIGTAIDIEFIASVWV